MQGAGRGGTIHHWVEYQWSGKERCTALFLERRKWTSTKVQGWLLPRGGSKEGEGGARSPCVALFTQACSLYHQSHHSKPSLVNILETETSVSMASLLCLGANLHFTCSGKATDNLPLCQGISLKSAQLTAPATLDSFLLEHTPSSFLPWRLVLALGSARNACS